MAQIMFFCKHCKRMVAFRREGHKIFCKECGREILVSYKNGSPTYPDSKSPEPMKVGTNEK